uniref:Immunoglobulin superfamily DCC subclass member 4 n=1 Tax=Oreochromis niloticus TaxID=8128 RepID=A0A669EEL5_ORENI
DFPSLTDFNVLLLTYKSLHALCLVSVELSCGAGPSHVVLEPGLPLLLDCNLGASDTPFNVSWLKDGQPLLPEGNDYLQYLVNGSVLLMPTSRNGQSPHGVAGAYSCVTGSSLGALMSRTVNVLLASLSKFRLEPSPQKVPTGGAARFECQIEGVPTPVITWEKDEVTIPEGTRFISLPNGVLQILEVTKDDEGVYRCVASNSAGKDISHEARLSVTTGSTEALNRVVIVAPPQNATVVLGHPAVMECMAQGQPKPLVSWSRQGNTGKLSYSFLSLPLILLFLYSTASVFHYQCLTRRLSTQGVTMLVSMSAEPTSPGPESLSLLLLSCKYPTVSLSRGNTARFLCNSSGEPPPVLHWLKNGQPIKSLRRVKTQSPGVLLINQLALEDAGYYQCIAENWLGTACATARLTVIVREGLPSPPRHLSAAPYSSTTALLSWEKPEYNSDQIIGYSVHCHSTAGSDNGEYEFAMNNDTTEYLFRELLPHTTYTFFVVAYSPMGASSPSLPITVEMLEDVPSAPPQLYIASTSRTDVKVKWHPLSSEQSRGVVTHYRIEYSILDQPDSVFSVEVGGNETHFTLRGLQPSQTYLLRIAAGTAIGFGVPSEWVQHKTPPIDSDDSMVIFAPTELKVRASVNTLNVTWQPSPNHTLVSGYKLSCREVEAEEAANGERTTQTHTIRLRKKARYHLLTGLGPDRQFEVRLWAFNKQTDGAAAVWKGKTEKPHAPPTTPGPPPPMPPSNIQATANSSTSIWLRWEKPRFNNVRIINYTVRCSPAGTTNASLVTYYTSSTQEILLGALKPFTRYELAVQSNGANVVGPFSGTVEESTLVDRPSTPPEELQLTMLDSSSVLVSWHPPLEPNGIIISYWILYSGNLSEPEHLWKNVSQDGSITSVEVQGLASGTRYFFKVGASTEVGSGPYSPIKEVHTLHQGYGMCQLDIHAVTGIIVGVCLGLICILLCMCFSFRNSKSRELSGALDSTAVIPQYKRGGCPIPSNIPECSNSYELETLMPAVSQESGQPPAEAPEEQSLMASANPLNGEGHAPAPEPKVYIFKGKVYFQMGIGYFFSVCCIYINFPFFHFFSL